MLGLTLFCTCILLVALTAGMYAMRVFAVISQAQALADQMALAGACKLNEHNQLGQLNELVGGCRQLVYASRLNYEQSAQIDDNLNLPIDNLHLLTEQLLSEDRDSALEIERQTMLWRSAALTKSTKAIAHAVETSYCHAGVPGLAIKYPEVQSISFGAVQSINSSVSAVKGIPELAAYDATIKVYEPTGTLYRGSANAKLPGEDSDLHFYLSSLAAPVSNWTAPPRLILPTAVVPVDNKYSPSAVRVSVTIPIEFHNDILPQLELTAVSAAASTGAATIP
jgi:hypothetical protein